MISMVGNNVSAELYPSDDLKLQEEHERGSDCGTWLFKVQGKQDMGHVPQEQIGLLLTKDLVCCWETSKAVSVAEIKTSVTLCNPA